MTFFARASDNTLWHQWWNSGAWSAPESLGVGLASGPGVSSWGANQLDVFVQGGGNILFQKWYDGQWRDWVPLTNGGSATAEKVTSDPATVSWASGRVGVFYRAGDGSLGQKWYDGAWRGPVTLGGQLIGSPAAASWGNNRLDVFVRGENNGLWHKGYDGQWREWEQLSGANTMTSDPAAVAWGPNRIDVFFRGTDNALMQMWWDGSRWQGPGTLGGVLTSGPSASSQGVDRLEVFVRDTTNKLQRRSWNGSQWDVWSLLPAGASAPPAQDPNKATVTITPPPTLPNLAVKFMVGSGSSPQRGYCGTFVGASTRSVWISGNPGGIIGCTVTVDKGTAMELNADPYRHGFTMDGWSGCPGTVSQA